MQFYVYIYSDPKTNKPVYVGKGKGKRAYAHFTAKTRLGRLLRKRQTEGFEMSPKIFNQPNEETALAMEQTLITWIGRLDFNTGTLFNCTSGGEGVCNPSPEIRERRTAAQKRRTTSDETRAKISIAKKNMSAETRAKMSAARKKVGGTGMSGKSHSLETRAKMSASQKARFEVK